MQLRELIEAVKEKNLSKDALENYRDDLANVFALMQFELAEIRKDKAKYFMDNRNDEQARPRTDVSIGRHWAVCKEGQREIELSHYAKATEKILSSLKARLYNTY